MSNLGNAQSLGFNVARTKHFNGKFDPQPGDTFGQWTIICKEPKYRYRVQCSCGVVTTVNKHSLRKGESKMCSMCSIRDRRIKRQNKNKGAL